ncbi:hypothetical protein [Lacticaseibacillus kribbianus]|uniref:hypothetical protein n=1 Tax=Lacticaseibacillus kribbianus TaxID=2926292 RepID=UPI001CD4C982|nr:hypothetical protein [Lacticaseibacillus kribbianus]
MLEDLTLTAGATLALLVGFAAVITWGNRALLQRLVNRAQRDSAHVWWARPGLWWHEGTHALVGRLFGLTVREVSVRASGQTAGHVTFALNPRSWWQHVGLFAAAGAPVWTSAAVILGVGKMVWWPRVAWRAVGLATLAPTWPGVAGWLVMSLALSLGAVLSPADLRQLMRGLPAVAALVLGVFAALALVWPAGLAAWRTGNALLALAGAVVTALSLLLGLLAAVLMRR